MLSDAKCITCVTPYTASLQGHVTGRPCYHLLSLSLCSGWEQLRSIIPFGAAKKPSEASTGPEEDQSFTLVFTGNSTMHLAVKSNGRSRNEWVAAFSDLASGLYADMLKPDEPKPE